MRQAYIIGPFTGTFIVILWPEFVFFLPAVRYFWFSPHVPDPNGSRNFQSVNDPAMDSVFSYLSRFLYLIV